ncbi:hypothetical protein AJ78_08445 [Emergomyces pasteurianus Ep9510]|uniref:Uncharacterized protein n=1 Tax=Emergomyces pasteurianus Ep9510 TaxID=1447872 RepID=A0A1J9P1C1_9EURO|nr:hypothetical protein AJ78_08445 [Emergomyces pasteurianus Ep9510]
MFKRKGWLCIGAISTFLLAAILCAVFSLQAICKRENRDSGILTIHFSGIDPRAGPLANGLGVPTPADPVFSNVAGDAHNAASDALAAAGTAIEDAVPKNLSLGTERYCVGYSDRKECNNLPATISRFLPKSVVSRKARKKAPESFEKYLAKITPGNIQGFLVVGLVAVPTLAILLALSLWKPRDRYRIWGILVRPEILHMLASAILFISFLVPTVLLSTLLSKSHQLPLKVDRGVVSGYCLVGLCAAAVMIGCIVVAPVIHKHS